ncbi:MAG: DUF3800 domain-containing protein [Hyphomicrobium aestuarii]|nr:DUF3800 domain-containing protein [Hyphomicrobium aestuarii]
MGQSKVPIYAYVDETGNTGHNLFDVAQPDFFTAALITKGNFDAVHGARALTIATKFGASSLHGKDLGVGRLEKIAPDVLSLIQSASATFFVSRVEKKYLLACKMFDSIFDSGENAAVGWHHYNFRQLRLMLTFKFSTMIDEDIARNFWKCILEPNEKKAYQALPDVCASLLKNLDRIVDHRAREIIEGGLDWARTHPESIQIHTDKKLVRQGHLPNLVAFTNLLKGLDNYSRRTKRRVARISHDQQSEFQRTLEMYHDLFSNASGDVISWAGDTYCLQLVPGSALEILEDSQSAGIQVVDIVLWLYAQFRKGKELPDGCLSILEYVFSNGWESDFSFDGVDRASADQLEATMARPFTADDEGRARETLESFETMRQLSMRRYENDKLPPFMRTRTKEIK